MKVERNVSNFKAHCAYIKQIIENPIFKNKKIIEYIDNTILALNNINCEVSICEMDKVINNYYAECIIGFAYELDYGLKWNRYPEKYITILNDAITNIKTFGISNEPIEDIDTISNLCKQEDTFKILYSLHNNTFDNSKLIIFAHTKVMLYSNSIIDEIKQYASTINSEAIKYDYAACLEFLNTIAILEKDYSPYVINYNRGYQPSEVTDTVVNVIGYCNSLTKHNNVNAEMKDYIKNVLYKNINTENATHYLNIINQMYNEMVDQSNVIDGYINYIVGKLGVDPYIIKYINENKKNLKSKKAKDDFIKALDVMTNNHSYGVVNTYDQLIDDLNKIDEISDLDDTQIIKLREKLNIIETKLKEKSKPKTITVSGETHNIIKKHCETTGDNIGDYTEKVLLKSIPDKINYIHINAIDVLYQPRVASKSIEIYGHKFIENVHSPSVFVVKTNYNKYNSINDISFNFKNIRYNLRQAIVYKFIEDTFIFECRFWDTQLIDKTAIGIIQTFNQIQI